MLGDETRQGDAWLRRRLDVAVRADARFAGHGLDVTSDS